ncbi:MAG TPA: hypothetical protein VJ914_09220 [Pseudonocardiaceae bacterium]|nr:hypothetical protein [Pseudonocardiaceae bacterium]
MRGGQLSGEWLEDLIESPAGNAWRTPRSTAVRPATSAPHPPLVSGGWYQGVDQEVPGPGRYPMARPARKSMAAALLWTLFLGPLGLCYLSAASGLVAAAATAVVFLAGGALTLAIIWPIAMILAFLAVWRQRVGQGHRVAGSGTPRPVREPATDNTWYLSNV